jgi:uncharacterized protein with HEPN domain
MIISEAAIKLGDTAAALQSDIPCREIPGRGNRLRHAYDSIDLTRIRLLNRTRSASSEGSLSGRTA